MRALHFEAALVPAPTEERFRPAALQRVPSPNFVCIVHRLNSLYLCGDCHKRHQSLKFTPWVFGNLNCQWGSESTVTASASGRMS